MLSRVVPARSSAKQPNHYHKETTESPQTDLSVPVQHRFDHVDLSSSGCPQFMKLYLKLATLAGEISEGSYQLYFNIIVVINIIVAGAMVGLQTYRSLANNETIDIINVVVLIVFIVEVCVKLVSHGNKPYMFFWGKDGSWNSFDLAVIILCLPLPGSIFNDSAPVIRIVSRVFRLARITRLLHEIPTLSVLFEGLLSGIKSITYIFLLLLLLFYMYAVMGVYFYRQADPFHFRNIPNALITLFKATTLEGWTDILRICMRGCHNYPMGLYIEEAAVEPDVWNSTPQMYRCTYPAKKPVVGLLYWISFTVISSLIMLSLFIAVITINMQQTLNIMHKNVEEKNKRKLMLKRTKDLVENVEHHNELENHEETNEVSAPKKKGILSIQEARRLKRMQEMKVLLVQAWHGTTVAADIHAQSDQESGFFQSLLRKITLKATEIVEHVYFNNFIIAMILLTSILVGLELDQSAVSRGRATIFSVIEYIIFSVFAAEVLLRMAAEEFNLMVYFTSGWNLFDFLVVGASQIPGVGSNYVVMLRLIRMLRVLKLIKSLPQLAVIINALLIGLSSISYVGVLIFLTYYVFAIFGVLFFRDNDPFHFSTLHQAMFTLFNIATLNNWGDVMYQSQYGCEVYPPGNTCDNPRAGGFVACLYFVVFIILGSFLLLTLFVGVVTTSMEEATKIQMVEKIMEARAQEICNENFISPKELTIYRRVFSMLDLDGSGTIEAAELLIGLSCLNIRPSEEELKKWILEVDINFDGVVDVVEFVTFMINMKKITAAAKSKKEASRDLSSRSLRQASSSSSSSEQGPQDRRVSFDDGQLGRGVDDEIYSDLSDGDHSSPRNADNSHCSGALANADGVAAMEGVGDDSSVMSIHSALSKPEREAHNDGHRHAHHHHRHRSHHHGEDHHSSMTSALDIVSAGLAALTEITEEQQQQPQPTKHSFFHSSTMPSDAASSFTTEPARGFSKGHGFLQHSASFFSSHHDHADNASQASNPDLVHAIHESTEEGDRHSGVQSHHSSFLHHQSNFNVHDNLKKFSAMIGLNTMDGEQPNSARDRDREQPVRRNSLQSSMDSMTDAVHYISDNVSHAVHPFIEDMAEAVHPFVEELDLVAHQAYEMASNVSDAVEASFQPD